MNYSNNGDAMYQRVMEFAKNKKPSGGLSNLYVIQKQDRDGNIVDEYYGMNLMTDYGMSEYFVNNKTFPTNIYIGNGTGSFNHTTNTLLSAITTTASTVSDKTIAYDFPLYYDRDSKLITCVCRYLVAYFDYNISGITDAISISEYGIGTAYNELWTHSWVYDKTGAQTYITKDVNERLIITVYMCMSYYESLITDGYKDGRYTIITSMRRFFEDKMWENNVYTYKRYNTGVARTRTKPSSGFMNNEIERHTVLSDIVMYNQADASSGYIDGFCQWSSGFMVLEPQQLDVSENVDVIVSSMDPTTNSGISDAFGHVDKIPITQIDVTSSALFNQKTGQYDNYEEFYNNANHCYCETPMQTYFPTPIYYTNNNTKMLMYVFQNVRTDDPIVALNNIDLSTIYVTNKYWDTSTWTLITNFDNIPEALQTMRYWITPSNTISLNPIRKSGHFRIIPTNGDIEQLVWGTDRNIYSVCDNYDYGWYMRGNTVYVPTKQKAYNIGVSGYVSTDSMTYGKWLVTYNSANTYFITDMSDLSVEPSPVTTTPLFSTPTNVFTNCYRSESQTGIICLQSLTANEANIIDLRTDTVTQTLLNSKLSVCVWGVNQVAYIPSDDTTKIRVHDFDVNGDIREFAIPDDITTTVAFMVAHRDYIWITDGSTYTYVMDIRDGSINGCTNNLPFNSGLADIRMTAVDDVQIIYKYSLYTVNDAYHVRYDKPTIINSLALFYENPKYKNTRMNLTLRYVHGTTLVLLMSHGYQYNGVLGSYNMVIDFGQYLNDDVKICYHHYGDTVANYIPYGEFIIRDLNKKIPMEYFLPHRIIGKTKTITALNNIKSIKGKTWSTIITNIPEFNGLPPGEVQ